MKKIIFLTLAIMLGWAPLIHKVAVYAAPETSVVDAGNKFCPVSGDKVSDKAGSVEYQGKRYGLCCAMCGGKFKKNPDKYIAKMMEREGKETEKAEGKGENGK